MPSQSIFKYPIESLRRLLLVFVLIFVGCSGCGQKTAPQTSASPETPEQAPERVEMPLSPDTQNDTPRLTDTPETRKTLENSPVVKIYESPQFKSILHPWHPVVVPPHVKERIEERIEVEARPQETGRASGNQYYKTNSAYREDVYRIYAEELGRIPAIRRLLGSIHSKKAFADLERAYAETPDDFETLLTWAVHGGWGTPEFPRLEDPTYGPEKLQAYRRLYEMNPTHPYILNELALSLLPTHPQEALGYALAAQRLEPRYIPRGVDGLCYAQLGEYEKALAAFQRAHAAAPEWLKPATIKRISSVRETMRSEKFQAFDQRARDAQIPVMSRMLLVRH